MNRYVFDKNSLGFEYHITKEHNIWFYLYFLYGLRNKDSTEYTGIESYVHNMIEKDNVGWIPILRSISAMEEEEEEMNGAEEKLDELVKELGVLKKMIDRKSN